LQWVQAYEVDNRTVRTVYGTLASVFPEVETFELELNDLLLVATKKKLHYDIEQIRQRIRTEPFQSALFLAWGAANAEGFFSHYVARSSFARAIAYVERLARNTDDQNFVEFGFARSAYQTSGASALEIRELAQSRNEHQPLGLERELDWNEVEDERVRFRLFEGAETAITDRMSRDQRVRVTAYSHFLAGRFREAMDAWRSQPHDPSGRAELAMVALALADGGDDAAVAYVDRLRPFQPLEADAIMGRLRLRQGKLDEAVRALTSAFVGYRRDPWPWPIILAYALDTAKGVVTQNPETLPAIRAALSEPFALLMFDEGRIEVLTSFAVGNEPDDSCADALRAIEPHVPWELPTLTWRARCYERVHDPNAGKATSELEEFMEGQPTPFGYGLGYVRAAP
jgi:hypothetical protein